MIFGLQFAREPPYKQLTGLQASIQVATRGNTLPVPLSSSAPFRLRLNPDLSVVLHLTDRSEVAQTHSRSDGAVLSVPALCAPRNEHYPPNALELFANA
jgi:hypothetical protein